jgi:hypothetical protein
VGSAYEDGWEGDVGWGLLVGIVFWKEFLLPGSEVPTFW